MSSDFGAIITNAFKLEEEKKHFGGEIYELSHKIPSIILTNDPEDQYNILSMTSRLVSLNIFFDGCGKDISILFAEIAKLYNLEAEKEDNPIGIQLMIKGIISIIGQLGFAVKETEDLLEKLKNTELKENEKIEILGKDYCFILIVLNAIYYHYTSIYQYIMNKKYLTDHFVNDKIVNPIISYASNALSIIITKELEDTKRYFRLLQCMNALADNPTVH